MKNEKISVIMSVYKESKQELQQSVESILNQTYKNIEYIIIIDNPEEAWRKEFIESYNDSRIKLYVNEKNMGLTSSLNRALKYVTGDYIARMDADDISLSNRLETQLLFLKKNNYDLCGCNMNVFFDINDNYISFFPKKVETVREILKYNNCVPHPTWLGKRDVFIKNKEYRDIYTCEDYDFIIRAILNGFNVGNCPEVLLKYRLSIGSVSRTNAGKQELIADYIKSFYKKNKYIDLNNFNEFYNSKRFIKKMKKYNYYYNLKNKRIREKNKKSLLFYLYSILMIVDIKFSFKELRIKYYNKKMLKKEKS